MRRGVALAALIAVTAGARGAAAAADEQLPVLLPVEGDRSIATLGDELERALAAHGHKVQRSALGLEDLMLAVGCPSTTIACLQEIGQNVKASGLIISRARRVKEGVELSVRWFDVATGGDRGELARLLPSDAASRAKILAEAVKALLGRPPPSSQEQTGGLSISASVPFVEIVLDGQVRGSVPLQLRGLRPGRYTVLARRDGYLSSEQTAMVSPNQLTQILIEMTPAPPQRVSYLGSIRPPTWVVGGAGLLCLAMGAAFAAHMKAQQDHLDAAQGITYQEIQQMLDYRDTGRRDALAANILFGLGGAALVGAAIFSYLDYRRAGSESASTPSVGVGPGSVSLHLGF